jgi:hypothetical protein
MDVGHVAREVAKLFSELFEKGGWPAIPGALIGGFITYKMAVGSATKERVESCTPSLANDCMSYGETTMVVIGVATVVGGLFGGGFGALVGWGIKNSRRTLVYKLEYADGADADPPTFKTEAPALVGDMIPLRTGRALRVIETRPRPTVGATRVLVVEPVELGDEVNA